MKKLLFSIAALVFTTAIFAQKKSDDVAKFKTETLELGKLKQDIPTAGVFEVTNIGKEPLVIQNATGSCGCTTPEWPKEPILPGKSAKITVHYNTQGRPGPIFKSVFIQSNAQLPEGKDRYEIFIRGTVTQAAPAAAPAK